MRRPDRRRRARGGRRRGSGSGRSNTPGSIDCARHRAAFGVDDVAQFQQPPPAADRQPDRRRRARAPAGSAAARTPRSRGRPTDPAARCRRGARRAASLVTTARSAWLMPRRAADQPARGHRGAAIVGAAVGEATSETSRGKLGLLRAHQASRRAVVRQHADRPRRSRPRGSPPRGRKRELAVGLARRRRHRPAPAARSPRAATSAGRSHSRRRSRVSALLSKPPIAGIGEDRGDQRVERRAAEPAGEPMAGLPVRPVAPHIGRRRKDRIGPRVPGPQMDRAEGRSSGRHRPATPDCRRRSRRAPGSNAPSIASRKRRWIRSSRRPLEKYGSAAVGRFRIGKRARLVGALVDGGTADLGEPDRLALRHPGGRRAKLGAADALVMRVRPPVPEILGAKHPRLAEAVGDRRCASARRAPRRRRSTSRSPRRRAGCRRDRRVVDRARSARGRDGRAARASRPAAHNSRCRPTSIGGRRPQRIERKAHLAAPRIDDMRAVFGPVGAIGDDRSRRRRSPSPRRRARRAASPPDRRRTPSARASGRATPSRSGRHRRRRRRPRGPRSAGPCGGSSSRSESPMPKNASICVAAAAVPSGEPGWPGAGSQVMRPRQG